MALNDQEKKQIIDAVLEALEVKRQRVLAERPPPAAKETKLYLITFSGHLIAFPDERGKAVHHQSVYARVTLAPEQSFYGGPVRVVAFGDGELLKVPFETVLSAGVTALVAVADDFLDRPRK